MATDVEHGPISDVEPEEVSHSAGLAQELQTSLSSRSTVGPEHRPASELLKSYTGELPPVYTGDAPTWDAPAVESPAVAEAAEKDAWYSEPSEVDRYPLDDSRTEATEPVSGEAPVQVLDTDIKPPIDIRPQAEPTGDEVERQVLESARRSALGLIEGFAHDGRVQVTRTERLAEDLGAGRRDVINRFGPRFIESIQRDPRLQGADAMKRTLTQSMDALLHTREIEPTKQDFETQQDRAQDLKDAISDTQSHITSEVEAGDLTSPKRNAGEMGANFNSVSRFIGDTLGKDEAIRSRYIGSLDAMLRSLDPQAQPDKPDSYSESGKILVKMIQLLQSKDGDHEKPEVFQQKWDEARLAMNQNLRQQAEVWAAVTTPTGNERLAA